ncbi:hypothetical protein [Lentibacillus halodurans]|uniref:hypothetical protein n=1 Tax=Lentibacillus halodurans TaxID=237679 RepID=UPI000B7CBC3A|nr:hypothetical protein [Lentibacillus halodurans]
MGEGIDQIHIDAGTQLKLSMLKTNITGQEGQHFTFSTVASLFIIDNDCERVTICLGIASLPF